MVVHSNDKYFYRSDGVSKNREAVVLEVNSNKEVAVAKLTTSQNPKYKNVPNYIGSRYMTEDLYTSDNDNKKIIISNSNICNDKNKFIKSKFPDIPKQSVEIIKNDLIKNTRFGNRNLKRLEQLKHKKTS